MLMVPSGLIISSRKKAFETYGAVNHVHKSLFKNKLWPIIILILSFLCFAYSGYINVKGTSGGH